MIEGCRFWVSTGHQCGGESAWASCAGLVFCATHGEAIRSQLDALTMRALRFRPLRSRRFF